MQATPQSGSAFGSSPPNGALADAREKLEDWRRDYNEVRPHGAIGNKPPAALLDCVGATSPPMSKETGKSILR